MPGERPLACVHCGEEIALDELFVPAERCAVGRVVAGPTAGLDDDVLEPAREHLRCAAGRVPERDVVGFTIGHGTRSNEELTELLRQHEIQLVADIRTVPKSGHNPQSAGAVLAGVLPAAGICYLHLPGLGGLRKPRPDSPNDGWRNQSFRGYADYMLTADFETALRELMDLVRVRRTATLCAETVYWRCHRSLVADALLIRGIPSLHVLGPGKAIKHTLTSFARPQGTRLFYPASEPDS